MRTRLTRLWPLLAPLFVLACGGGASLRSDSAGADAGAAAGGDSSQTARKPGFQPPPIFQPTESGAWVIDPADPLTLYALGDRSLVSNDGGHTWSALGWPAGAQALLFSEQPVRALYLEVEASAPTAAPSASKLLKSVNGGATWTEVGTAPGGPLTLVDLNPQPVLLSMRDDGVWRSADDGASWVASPLPMVDQLSPFQLGKLLVSGGANPVLYLEAAAFASTAYQATVYVSKDGGLTFDAKAVPAASNPSFPPNLSLDCRGRLYFLDGSTVHRSSDAGSSWETAATLEPNVSGFRVLSAAPSECSDAVYAFGEIAQGSRVWHLDAEGTVSSQAVPHYGVVSDLGRDRLLLVSDYEILRQRSDDGGRSWWTAGIDLAGQLALSPAQEGLLFVASNFAVSRSDDDGKSWSVAPGPVGIWLDSVYPDATDPNVLYARTSYGKEFDFSAIPTPYSFISRDGGASFQNWPVPTQAKPEVPQAIASSTSGRVTIVTQGGVYTTEDRGQHFSSLLPLPNKNSVLRTAIGATDPLAIYVALFDDASPTHEIVASLDGGSTWRSSDPGAYVQCLVAHPTDAQIAFACPIDDSPELGLMRTLDGGATWSRISTPESAWSVQIDPIEPHALYALGQHVYRSLDHGDTWQPPLDFPSNPYSFELALAGPGGSRYTLSPRGLLEKWSRTN